ncbi:MAG TPA: flippase [Candidatus Gastranaerophilales bacterium]|nr:flippase [Candidatus Gastranaerophilales bacterium]
MESCSDIKEAKNKFSNLTSKKTLIKNVVFNLLGKILPMGIALFTIPIIINNMGNERFGILTIIWMLIGYSSIFDLGLGRALTQMVSKKIGENDVKELPPIIWTASSLLFFMGIIAGIAIFSFSTFIVVDLLKVSEIYRHETVNAIKLVALCIPMLFFNGAFNGVLTSYQKFGTINLVTAPLALFNFVSPLLVFIFTNNLAAVVGTLVFGRALVSVTYFIVCLKTVDNLYKFKIDFKFIKPLLSYGSWITVSNIISPLMSTFDRFIISNQLSASVVAFYTTPYELTARLVVLPGAIVSVLFPAFSMEIVSNPQRAKNLFHKATKYLFFILLIPVIIIILFAKTGLSLWINPEFAENSFRIAQVISAGVLFNGLAFIPYCFIQAYGKSDMTAKFHLIEFPVYMILLFGLINVFGILGAAFAWTIRVIMDYLLLYFYSLKLLKKIKT